MFSKLKPTIYALTFLLGLTVASSAFSSTLRPPLNLGLVGYWSFDEGSGTAVGDMSGNGKSGTISGASWDSGKRGQALSFDGTDDYVDLGNINSDVRAISFWVKASTTTNRIIDLNGTAKVELSGGTITTSGITSPTIYVDGVVSSTLDTNWHYVTITTGTGLSASAVKVGQGDAWACGDTLTDSRDSKNYATVQIGSQCWMKQNINVGTRVGGVESQGATCTDAADIEKWCYFDLDANCDSNNNPNYPDGALYQWDQVMCGAATCNGTGESQPACASPIQGICPIGWHIPSHYEFTVLERTVCTSGSCTTDFPYNVTTSGWRGTDEGTKLKSGGSSDWEGNLTGSYYSGFINRSILGGFLSSTEYNETFAWRRELTSGNTTVGRNVNLGKTSGYSVRCLKDDPPTSYFTGKLDEVRFYSRELAAGEAASLHQSGLIKYKSLDNTGLVGYWSFEEGSGTKAGDMSGKGNNGILSGATLPTWINGKRGNALDFDGSTGYTDIGNNLMIKSSLPITMSAWIYLEGTTGSGQHIVQNDGFKGNYYGAVLKLKSNSLVEVSYGDGGVAGAENRRTKDGATTISLNSWYHVVGIIKGATDMDIYINGINDGGSYSGSGDAMQYSTASGTIGQNGTTDFNNNFNGKIDEVRVYNRALLPTEVASLYQASGRKTTINSSQNTQLTTGLVGLWSFNGPDISGSLALDRSGNGNNGTISGAATTIGKVGQGMRFDGADDYVSVADHNSLTFGNGTTDTPFSVAAWVYYIDTRDGNGFSVVGKYTNAGPFDGEYLMKIYESSEFGTAGADQLHLQLVDDSATNRIRVESTTAIPRNQWVYVVATYDGSGDDTGLNLYSNGLIMSVDRTEQGDYVAMDNESSFLSIGASLINHSADDYGLGTIDEVRVYNRALSAAEIKRLYNLGK